MKTFYVTFGQKYRHEPHPVLPEAHPDGYLAIEADTEEQARAKAFELTGGKFAFMYQTEPERAFYPLGEIDRVTAVLTGGGEA